MPHSNPAVSVVLPTYNRASLLGRAMESVLSQSYTDLELIVVDDGSTDDTWERVKGFVGDPRVRYVRHDNNRGAAAALNTGVMASSGTFIAFQNSDDEWLPDKLARQIPILETQPDEVGMVYSDMWRIQDGRQWHWPSPAFGPHDGLIYHRALGLEIMNIGILTAVIRRTCVQQAGLFDERFPRLIDLEFFIRLSKHCRFYHVGEPLVKYYRTPGSISDSRAALIKAHEMLLKKYRQDIEKDRRLLAKYLDTIGNLYLELGDGRARAYLAASYAVLADV